MQNRKFNLKKCKQKENSDKNQGMAIILVIKIQEQLFYFCIFACGGSKQKPGSRNWKWRVFNSYSLVPDAFWNAELLKSP